MEREIKFRGLRTDNKEWVYGGLVSSINSSFNHEICFRKEYKGAILLEKHYVYDETVGQFTGLKDKKGVEIYEGDIVEHSMGGLKGIISFFEGSFIAGKAITSNSLINFNAPKYLEVIGNIHEK